MDQLAEDRFTKQNGEDLGLRSLRCGQLIHERNADSGSDGA